MSIEFDNRIYCMSNVSELRKLGTTNFFRYLKDFPEQVMGLVRITEHFPMTELNQVSKRVRHYLSFELIEDKLEDVDNIPTITNLLNNISITEIKSDLSLLKSLARDYDIIRVETEVADYRNNRNPKLFKVTYRTSEEIITRDRTIEYSKVHEEYQELDKQKQEQQKGKVIDIDNYRPKEIERELEISRFNTNKKGDIRGF